MKLNKLEHGSKKTMRKTHFLKKTHYPKGFKHSDISQDDTWNTVQPAESPFSSNYSVLKSGFATNTTQKNQLWRSILPQAKRDGSTHLWIKELTNCVHIQKFSKHIRKQWSNPTNMYLTFDPTYLVDHFIVTLLNMRDLIIEDMAKIGL